VKISVVVPTYNESKDIRETLESLVGLNYGDKEIIVVDDSTDSTPEIVKEYSGQGIKLIVPEKRDGRCGARNIGILAAKGEVVVVLNADVRPPPNFLCRIAEHYERGCDYLLVSSRVSNMDDLFGRYVECCGKYGFYDNDPEAMEWTEGFSCRKKVAIEAGLFPTGFPVAICAGEDGFFGSRLRSMGVRKCVDLSIIVEHVAPGRFAEFWDIRKGRGKGSPQVRRYLEGWSMGRIKVWAALRVLKTSLEIGTIFSPIILGYLLARHSPRGAMRDIFPFAYAVALEKISFCVGEWESIAEIEKAERVTTLLGNSDGAH